jgi:hypothetical protein
MPFDFITDADFVRHHPAAAEMPLTEVLPPDGTAWAVRRSGLYLSSVTRNWRKPHFTRFDSLAKRWSHKAVPLAAISFLQNEAGLGHVAFEVVSVKLSVAERKSNAVVVVP